MSFLKKITKELETFGIGGDKKKEDEHGSSHGEHSGKTSTCRPSWDPAYSC